jgi:RecA/RadA recombinase
MKLTVYKNQFGFSTLAKNGDVKIYIPVQFKQGIAEPEGEKAEIELEDAFFSNYTDKNGLTKPKLIVMQYKELGDTTEYTDTFEFEGDLPF